jgi:hypothetical protein
MKIFINKNKLLKNLNLDEKINAGHAIIRAAQAYYKPYEVVVEIEGTLISIDLNDVHPADLMDDFLIQTQSIGRVRLGKAIPLLEKLLQNDPKNRECFEDLLNAYDLRGDLDKVLEPLLT